MKKLITFSLSLIIILTSCSSPQEPVETNEVELFGTYTLSELEADADRLRTIVDAYSVKLFTDEEEYEATYETAVAGLREGMTGLEFIRAMKPFVASIRCGHTQLFPDIDYDKVELMPLDIEVLGGKLYISRSAVKTDIPMGSEIIAINGRSAEDILKTMEKGMSRDGYNITNSHYLFSRMFAREYAYHVEYAGEFDISYTTPGGDDGNETLQSVKANIYNRKLYESRDTAFASEFGEDHAILSAYTFNPYGDNASAAFKEYFDEFFLDVAEKGIGNVILDVRGNGGGDPYITSHLFSYLENEPYPYFSTESPNYYSGLNDPIPMAENNFGGNLYILIDGGSFSSTGHLIALLDYHDIGTFIGVESGASYICTDSSRDADLPNTGAHFHYSTQAWSVAVEGLTHGRGIMPDYEIQPTIDDVLKGTDPLMEFVLDTIY